MSFELKEKLIKLVKKYQCIYNPAHKQYKNISYKTSLWDDIGAELNIEGKYTIYQSKKNKVSNKNLGK